MNTVVEELEGSRVKLAVELNENELQQALSGTLIKLARTVQVPGFRRGKVPHKILEAKLGGQTVLRQKMLEESLSDFFVQAARQADLDPVSTPEIEIKQGMDSGIVAFDAVVEVRPKISVAGYQGLAVTVPSLEVSPKDVEEQIDKLREQFGQLVTATRPGVNGDFLTIDINAYIHKELQTDLTASDLVYQLGSGSITKELDENLLHCTPGDIYKFNSFISERPAAVAQQEKAQKEVSFQVLVKEVKTKVLPDVTDSWVADVSEFETLDQLKDDIRSSLAKRKKEFAAFAIKGLTLSALVDLVHEDIPSSMVDAQLKQKLAVLETQLGANGLTLSDWLSRASLSEEELLAKLSEEALWDVKADLALRAVAEIEDIQIGENDIVSEVKRLAGEHGTDEKIFFAELQHKGGDIAIKWGLRKNKALSWLVDNVNIVDENGNVIERKQLEENQEGEPDNG
ncbi:MAG: trigger factor [Actinobacteria bacterium]|nr:trigger factor [Actinomycetota bacterium]MCL6105351.1 trigger factor [Actinomycetota bacterium]